jgi:hypothetical protein
MAVRSWGNTAQFAQQCATRRRRRPARRRAAPRARAPPPAAAPAAPPQQGTARPRGAGLLRLVAAALWG